MIGIPWLPVAITLTAAVSLFTGWQARTVIAERDRLREHALQLEKLAERERQARQAADEYAKLRDAIEPKIRVVRVQSEPIVKILERCPLPDGAASLLHRAADLADARAGNRADAGGSEIANGSGTDGR